MNKAQKLSIYLFQNSLPNIIDIPLTEKEWLIKYRDMDKILCKMSDRQLDKILNSSS